MIAIYCLTLIGLIHNTVAYLVIQSKWRLFLISTTYALFFFILGTRLASLSLFLRFYLINQHNKTFAANELDTVATYAKLMLEIY
jgi:hypothetical protein